MPRSLGHGLCILDRKRKSGKPLIGFVEGYEWLHGRSNTVVIYTIEPDSETTEAVLREVRKILEGGLKFKKLPVGRVTSRIEIMANA